MGGSPGDAELILQPFRHFTYVIAQSPTLPPLYLRHRSFSNPFVASPTSQLILQPFRCFTYVTVHFPTLLSRFLRHRLFTYVTQRVAHELQYKQELTYFGEVSTMRRTVISVRYEQSKKEQTNNRLLHRQPRYINIIVEYRLVQKCSTQNSTICDLYGFDSQVQSYKQTQVSLLDQCHRKQNLGICCVQLCEEVIMDGTWSMLPHNLTLVITTTCSCRYIGCAAADPIMMNQAMFTLHCPSCSSCIFQYTTY